MKIINLLKISTVLLLLVLIKSLDVAAQAPPSDTKDPEIRQLQTGTHIWTGTTGLRRETHYFPRPDGFEKNVQTLLDVELRFLRLTDKHFGWGIQGLGELFMSGTFGNVGLGNIGLGPVLRGYPWQNERWQSYLQGVFLAGYDLALGDAIGANRGEGMRYRAGLRGGLTYRVSNALGLYLELGPDWEADESFQFDSRAIQLDIGIQLFRF